MSSTTQQTSAASSQSTNNSVTVTSATTTSSTSASTTRSGTNRTAASTPITTMTPTSGSFSVTAVVPKREDTSGFISSGAALAIFLVISLLVIAGGFIYIRKKGKQSCKSFKTWLPGRKRRSSTSSRGQLTEENETLACTYRSQNEMELFSIGDNDNDNVVHPNYSRRRATEDDYFYDEIFERSAFVDKATNKANKHLAADDGEDEDDVSAYTNRPDVLFKKPMKRV